MKKYLLLVALAAATSSQAADWTPVFEHLQVGKNDNDDDITWTIRQSIFEDIPKPNPLTKEARQGTYTSIPKPYRKDMMPAKFIKGKEDEGPILKGIIPLKNATLYGYPLKSLNYDLYCHDCGDTSFYATFAPMTLSQHNSLVKKVKFKYEGDICGDPRHIARFERVGKTTVLIVDDGC